MTASKLCGPRARSKASREAKSVFWKSGVTPFPIVINNASFVEEEDLNPGGGIKGKGKSCSGGGNG